jgi:hypothetical protein
VVTTGWVRGLNAQRVNPMSTSSPTKGACPDDPLNKMVQRLPPRRRATPGAQVAARRLDLLGHRWPSHPPIQPDVPSTFPEDTPPSVPVMDDGGASRAQHGAPGGAEAAWAARIPASSAAMEQPLGVPDATDPLAAMMRRSAGGWVDRQLLKLLASLLADLPARLDRVDAMLELPWWRRLFG